MNEKQWKHLSVDQANKALHEETAHLISPVTKRNRDAITRRLTAHFGQKQLGRIRPTDLTAYQKNRLKAGKGTGTINADLQHLSMLLRRADLWHRFHRYKPLQRHDPPKGRALSQQEIEALIAAVPRSTRYLDAADAMLLAITTAMRWREIRDLRWSDVSFLDRLINIKRSKTPAGWRTVPLNSTALSMLLQRHERAKATGHHAPAHHVFPSAKGPDKPIGNVFSAWKKIRERAGVSARFHDLRHTAVTNLHEYGVSEPTARAMVGHLSPQMTRVYTHPRLDSLRQAADALNPVPPDPPKKGVQTHVPSPARRVESHPAQKHQDAKTGVLRKPPSRLDGNRNNRCRRLERKPRRV